MPTPDRVAEFEQLLRAVGGNPVPASQPAEIARVWAFSGVEVALAPTPVPVRRLGRVWGQRRGSRAIPLLVVTGDGGGGPGLLVAGPERAQPIRAVGAAPLVAEIARVREYSQNRASAELEAALAGLASEALPGVQVRGLLTDHYVQLRLERRGGELKARLEALARPLSGTTWRTALQSLGFQVADRPTAQAAMVGQRTVALIHAKREATQFARIDESGRLPEGALIAACQAEGVAWGIMATGSRMRLFEARTGRGSATDRWIELDLAALPESRRYLAGLFAPEALSEGGIWQDLLQDAADFGTKLKVRLDDQIRKTALPEAARGLGDWLAAEGRDLSEPATRQEIQQATYTLLFRLLFILYAESAGHLPIATSTSYSHNALRTVCQDAREVGARAGGTALWDRLQVLVKAIRDGSRSMGLPQYNGSLFAPDDLAGARLLEQARVADQHLAPVLVALAFDPEADDDVGLDYTDLDIAHIGNIYEGLLALRLSLADQTYTWDSGGDRFVAADEPGPYGVRQGELFFQTAAGGRKGGGVYYTRQEFVRHLVSYAVLPALDEHLDGVRRLASTDPEAATRLLFRFRVLDPAMGSGHFLVDAIDVLAERVQRFLADNPLPPLRGLLDALRVEASVPLTDADDAQLLRRLLLKHCIYGVDLSEMAVELARVALWLATFVPGLALSYLDQNLKRGDSLVGVAKVETVVLSSKGRRAAAAMWAAPGGPLDRAIADAGALAARIADSPDRTKAEVEESKRLREELEDRLGGVKRAFDLWAAEPFGVSGARAELDRAAELIEGEVSDARAIRLLAESKIEARERNFFHWPLEFPEVFHRRSESNPGFDAVVGNPPWDEITVEELGFYGLHDPGLRGVTSGPEQRRRIAELQARFPELAPEFDHRRTELATQRRFFRPENGYSQQGGGDADLYQLFCERYAAVTRDGGHLGVVLPRSTFLGEGGRGFRRWLFRSCKLGRLDVLLNSARWAFDMEARYTLCLLTAETGQRPKGGVLTTTGPSRSLAEFVANTTAAGVPIALDDLAGWTPPQHDDRVQEPTWELPLLPTPAHARLLGKLRQGPRFDVWAKANHGVFAVTELHETQQRAYFQEASGVPVWKGRSFDQYDPHGREPAGFGEWDKILAFVQGKRVSARSNFAGKFPPEVLEDPTLHPINHARVAFRDVSRATDSRTIRACLVPPRTPLTNKAPYLVFPSGQATEQSLLLGVLNSVTFDWLARRYIETNVNFFILNMLCLPEPDASAIGAIASRAARLSCPDDRFSEFAAAVGVDCGPLPENQRDTLRAEIDAHVALAYGLDLDDLERIFEDFTLSAVSESYRARVREAFASLVGAG